MVKWFNEFVKAYLLSMGISVGIVLTHLVVAYQKTSLTDFFLMTGCFTTILMVQSAYQAYRSNK